ncbi:MAG TPA: bifunctional diaminohydroxyphosphoribosylaminopyrimidine deaminase/5-amino-6-(5-phosphoribosylamino)uracil reductase RibD [Terriglobales bacterium]|nr:bifunctional diaminohydroxyphosphoribosylaminopyrimidine deaminase/5-amino-6-(5-phosphoribosylamino)uracil reductase RibD [Terriglobales bacterium]
MSEDAQYMARALELAREGIGLASPNPCVGAVVVSQSGQVVGEGTHTYEGRKHAEVIALERAGDHARGATLYLNLEPCCHRGRTGPCSDAVIASGIKRVVASMADPNPLVAGQGFARLQAAGVEMAVGLYEREARKLNESFAMFIRTKQPLVLLKTAMTLDGKIAPAGESDGPSALGVAAATRGWITSELARAHVQELRHQSDAIMVGVGTIIADDPLLTDRSGRARRRPLMRVILDSRLRIPLQSRVVRTAQNDVTVFCSFAEEEKKRELEALGVRVEKVEFQGFSARPDLSQVLQRLGELEITSLMIEGGSTVNWAALTSGAIDKVFLYYAPKILGGTGAVPFASGIGFRKLADATTIRNVQLHRFGEDFAVEGYVHDPYA